MLDVLSCSFFSRSHAQEDVGREGEHHEMPWCRDPANPHRGCLGCGGQPHLLVCPPGQRSGLLGRQPFEAPPTFNRPMFGWFLRWPRPWSVQECGQSSGSLRWHCRRDCGAVRRSARIYENLGEVVYRLWTTESRFEKQWFLGLGSLAEANWTTWSCLLASLATAKDAIWCWPLQVHWNRWHHDRSCQEAQGQRQTSSVVRGAFLTVGCNYTATAKKSYSANKHVF